MNLKLWFVGMKVDIEVIGVGIYMLDGGMQNIEMIVVYMQDMCGFGLFVIGDSDIKFDGMIDEVVGGCFEF